MPPEPGSEVPGFYANFVRIQGGVVDVTIDFGRQWPTQPGEQPRVEWLTRVTMTWEEAGLLQKFLGQHIDAIQQSLGEDIRDLPELLAKIQSQMQQT